MGLRVLLRRKECLVWFWMVWSNIASGTDIRSKLPITKWLRAQEPEKHLVYQGGECRSTGTSNWADLRNYFSHHRHIFSSTPEWELNTNSLVGFRLCSRCQERMFGGCVRVEWESLRAQILAALLRNRGSEKSPFSSKLSSPITLYKHSRTLWPTVL